MDLVEGAFFIAIGLTCFLLATAQSENRRIGVYALIFLLYFATSFTKYFTGSTENFFVQVSHSGHI